MKVINLIEEGRIGGPQYRILRVIPHLVFFGVETIVILPQNNSSIFQDNLIEADIQFNVVPLTTMRKHPKQVITYLLKFLPELFFLTLLIRKLNPDIVHVSGGSWQIKGVLAGRLACCKVVWHLNDTKTPKVLKLLFQVIKPLANAFITAGNRVQEYYLPNEKKRPIFNISAPVDCSVFSPSLVRKKCSEDVSRIITVANINPTKGLEIFIEIAAILSNKIDRSMEFRIVGPIYDSQRKYFEKLKNLERKFKLKNLFFVGYVDDIRKELANADIYVCTSLAEASPTSVWEALAMGKPSVTTNVGEVNKVIENEISGIISKNNDPQELSKIIEYLLLHKEAAKTMGKKACVRAKKLLDVKVIAKQHYEAYRKIIEIY